MNRRVMLADVARPILRLLPRGAGRVLSLIGGGPDSSVWRHAPYRFRVFYDRTLACWIAVDLGEWFGRLHYYSARYYDRGIPHVIRTFLGPGDTFVDIGAHYGIHTLAAVRHVGPTGKVFSFEPNPRSFSLLKAHLAINHIDNAIAENAGVSDEAGTLALSWDDTNTATFRADTRAKFSAVVPVVCGDDALASLDASRRILIKIDTEGYEHRVIRGLRHTLARPNVGVVAEITDAWLRETGSSAEALIDDMKALSFRPYAVDVRATTFGARVEVRPISQTPTAWQYDLFFAKI